MAQKCKIFKIGGLSHGIPTISHLSRHIAKAEDRHPGPSRRWQEALLVVGAMRSTGGADRPVPVEGLMMVKWVFTGDVLVIRPQ